MLILSRRPGERVIIGEGTGAVTILVAEAASGRCRLGITAPPDTLIRRAELSPDAACLTIHRAEKEGNA